MKITVISMWYDEAILAPYFLGHYAFADEIRILLDPKTEDGTADICRRYANVSMEEFGFPDNKFDDLLKIEKLNAVYRSLKSDWVIVADSDEFVFPLPYGRDMRTALMELSQFDLAYARMWQVYRHRTDRDLDLQLPAVPQRRHGDPNVSTGINALYTKPIIARGQLHIAWTVGCHNWMPLAPTGRWRRFLRQALPRSLRVAPRHFGGVHWAMADLSIGLRRRLPKRARLSARNLEEGWGQQHFDLTAEKIRNECEAHLDDPQLF